MVIFSAVPQSFQDVLFIRAYRGERNHFFSLPMLRFRSGRGVKVFSLSMCLWYFWYFGNFRTPYLSQIEVQTFFLPAPFFRGAEHSSFYDTAVASTSCTEVLFAAFSSARFQRISVYWVRRCELSL